MNRHLFMVLFGSFCFLGCNKAENNSDKPKPVDTKIVADTQENSQAKGKPDPLKLPENVGSSGGTDKKKDQVPEKGSLKDAPPAGTSVVISEGVGTTQNEALRDAFRNAVQRVVGVFVDSETLVKNDAIISDEVLTFSDGAIKKYEELESSDNKGLFRVKIKAAVERREVAARLEAAHISMKSVDVKNIAEAFSKEIRADLDRLANEITEKEAKENARKILENDLSRIAKMNMIEAKVVGEPERGSKVGNKVPLKIKVRFEINETVFHAAMTKLEKSLLMNSSSWGPITFSATPELVMKRENQSSINEEIGKDNVVVLVNKGLAKEKWRSIWNYYVVPVDIGKLVSKQLVEKKAPKVKLSLLDKDDTFVAGDEFTADHVVRAFRYNPIVPEDKLHYQLHKLPPTARARKEYLDNLAREYNIDISSVKYKEDPNNWGAVLPIIEFLRSRQQRPAFSNRPFNSNCCFASPLFFNLTPDIRYMVEFEQEREVLLTLEEINLFKSVKCELFP